MRRAANITVAQAVGGPALGAAEEVMRSSWADPGVMTPDVEADRLLYLLAHLGGCPAGALRLCFWGKVVHLERLSVASDHRWHGIADQLVEAALSEARKAGCYRAVGFVRHRHKRYWARRGIQPDGTTAERRGETVYGIARDL